MGMKQKIDKNGRLKKANFFEIINSLSLQAGIEFKKNLRVRFGNYGGLKLEYFWVVKSKKAKSFIRA